MFESREEGHDASFITKVERSNEEWFDESGDLVDGSLTSWEIRELEISTVRHVDLCPESQLGRELDWIEDGRKSAINHDRRSVTLCDYTHSPALGHGSYA